MVNLTLYEINENLNDRFPKTMDKWYSILYAAMRFVEENIVEQFYKFTRYLEDNHEDKLNLVYFFQDLDDALYGIWLRIQSWVDNNIGLPYCPWEDQIEEYGEPYYSRFWIHKTWAMYKLWIIRC